jgi:hypothetical protein
LTDEVARVINISMAVKAKNYKTKSVRGRTEKQGLPVTLQALRDRAGFTAEDGAGADLREFFAESKFSGEPDRKTAIAVVALDTILRDPSMLDATTCFGEGQIDTAVNAANLILGEARTKKLETISGENDLEELAEICRKMSGEEDIKCGVMSARHLWGMFNTATRGFPAEFFRNGKSDDFQAALLGVAGRHLSIFSAESMDATAELSQMVGQAEKIVELGEGGKYHRNPGTEKQVAEAFLFFCKQGRYAELSKSSLLESLGEVGSPSDKARTVCGLKERKARKKKGGAGEENDSWREDVALEGNGAFFAGRVFEEVKARYPGYPGHSSESTYWDTCLKHPATHGICSRLYSKVGQLVKSGGVEEGISRAVTNKMVHHNTKFSRLSMLVHLSNGKSFHVHRTRPINWESHGVDNPPFAPGIDVESGQLELGFGGAGAQTAKKAGKGRGKGGVQVVGYELRVVNYSHMPWVNKAISQYVEEAPFIKSPKDEHQQIVSILAKELRGEGVTYRQAFERAADLYSGLTGRADRGAKETELLLSRAWSQTEEAENLETDMAGLLREARAKSGMRLSEALRPGENEELLSNIVQTAVLDLAKACDVLSKYGVSEDKAREVVLALAGKYPIGKPENGSEQVYQAIREAGLDFEIRAIEAGNIAKLACGVGSRVVKDALPLSEDDRKDMREALTAVIESGVFYEGGDHKLSMRTGGGDKGEIDQYLDLVVKIGAKIGINHKEALGAGEGGARIASGILPEVERTFAENGGEASPELLKQILQYAVKHSEHNPLTGEELHHRKVVGGGVDPVSLDAPIGEDLGQNLYSVVKGEDRQDRQAIDYDPDDAAFEAGATDHWMDREAGEGGFGAENSPSFIAEGGGEFFAPFSSSRIADSLYTVVSSKGTEQQVQMLKDFAGLKVESIAGAGDGQDARRQISAMLDMVDQEEVLQDEPKAIRRRFLSWVFNSVLNAAGVDGDGFDKLGGIGAGTLRKGLFEKIRRYGMPGVIVVENPDAEKAETLFEGVKKAKSWGYSNVGVCLPKKVEQNLRDWGATGGAENLCQVIAGLRDSRELISQSIEKGASDESLREAGLLLGEVSRGGGRSQSLPLNEKREKSSPMNPETEKKLLEIVKECEPELHQKLVLAKMAVAVGMELSCLGDSNNKDEVADRAKMDSVIFVDKGRAKSVGEAVSGFGIKVRLVPSNPEQALRDHIDYQSANTLKDGTLDKNKLIDNTKIPLSRKLLLAAETAQEAMDKTQRGSGY